MTRLKRLSHLKCLGGEILDYSEEAKQWSDPPLLGVLKPPFEGGQGPYQDAPFPCLPPLVFLGQQLFVVHVRPRYAFAPAPKRSRK